MRSGDLEINASQLWPLRGLKSSERRNTSKQQTETDTFTSVLEQRENPWASEPQGGRILLKAVAGGVRRRWHLRCFLTGE